jgi:DNA-binding XRE family transcriptional regulator
VFIFLVYSTRTQRLSLATHRRQPFIILYNFPALGYNIYIYIKERAGVQVNTWQARQDKNITLIELAKLTGLSKSTLNNIENGKTSPTLYELELIAKALGTKITKLFESEYK